MIYKATLDDVSRIAEIYQAIHTEEEEGRACVGWQRGVYPVKETAEEALSRGELFALWRDDRIVGAGVLNHRQMPQYAQCPWLYQASPQEVLVLHTLVIDPQMAGQGCGKEFVTFYEEYAREKGCRVLRIDTQEKNQAARSMYAKLGFREAGVVLGVFNGIPGVRLVCLEKQVE